MLCFQREVCKRFRCSKTTACAGASTRGSSCSWTPAPTLPLCWDCVLPTSPSLFCLLPPRRNRVHSCRMEQLGGTSRLRFCQARSACASPGGESCGRSEERTEGREPWAHLAWGAQSTHTERTAQRPPPAGSFPPKCPRRGSGASTRSSPQGAGRGGAHSQLVGAAVVELELGADECPARLPRLQLQHHAKPVCGAEQRQSAPRL